MTAHPSPQAEWTAWLAALDDGGLALIARARPAQFMGERFASLSAQLGRDGAGQWVRSEAKRLLRERAGKGGG